MRFIAAALLSAIFLAACGNDTTNEPNTDAGATEPAEASANSVDVSMTEYAYGMPTEVEGGSVTFNFTNAGELPHEAAFGSIEGDRDVNDLLKALEKGEPPSWAQDLAGLPVLSPGVDAAMTRELDEGRYVFFCFLPTPKGAPHFTEGMVHVFDVVGTSDAPAPEADLTITATDDTFEVPDITAGTHTIEMVNEASKPREFQIYSLEEGMTAQDIDKWFGSGFKTPAPALFPGGMQSLKPGTSVIMEITFEASRTYTIEDFGSKTSVEFEVS